jgi:hypothetical protein
VYTPRLDGQNRAFLGRRTLRRLLGRAVKADVVSVLIMQNDPSELVDRYARYTLNANGVTQPGG